LFSILFYFNVTVACPVVLPAIISEDAFSPLDMPEGLNHSS
jgi:hypothetical protein